MISAAYNIFCFIIDLMPRKTLYYILTPSHIIIWGKDRFDCLLGEGFFVCVCLEGGGWVGVLQETVSRFYRWQPSAKEEIALRHKNVRVEHFDANACFER